MSLSGIRVNYTDGHGSVRAFRASLRNEEYVKDVAEKRAKADKKVAETKERARINPFSVCCVQFTEPSF